ncbi:MAG: hypothetical protein CL671_15465 [Balneola sp.]|jgi:hypothetical protein|nr:hypothetical protein [Balneola sp.]MAO77499.1 hypothetical protein [Balneola sp.]MBF66008.1 hypothetical protein [Balneola sp.]|tara:strand:+ start:5860 stop:7029 length:1170 start_codon:yes stop_codon:yes gene_type:complete
MNRYNIGLLIAALFTFMSCSGNTETANNAGYVTLLGNDTLAVETFEKTNASISAKVVLRSPRTTLKSYELSLTESGGINEMTIKDYDLDNGFDSKGTVERSYIKSGDSLVVSILTNDGTYRTLTTTYEEGILPFIDMVHWPFEVAFNNAMQTTADSIDQRLLTGSRASTFIVAKIDTDSMTIRHPSRGVMGVKVDRNGNIVELDASETTRKLTVKRANNIEINSIAKRFASSDKQGNPFGSLSGAVDEEFIIGNTEFNVSYGTPQRRGRNLFGGIVPFGQRWRTGANRATHFKTSSNLRIGDLKVPAGEYTLFSIPEKDGGLLIINKQTGQNGQTYDQERDLGRVPMSVSNKADSTEGFTILVEGENNSGVIKLIWGNTVYSVDFEIEN